MLEQDSNPLPRHLGGFFIPVQGGNLGVLQWWMRGSLPSHRSLLKPKVLGSIPQRCLKGRKSHIFPQL